MTGLPGSSKSRKSCGSLEDVPLLAQDAVLSAQTGQFLALLGGEPAASASIDVWLADPIADRGLGPGRG
jgi:hypothetical protein